MKITKSSIITLLTLGGLLICSTSMAQDSKEGKKGKGQFPTVQERMDKLTTELTLTDDQKPKVEAVLKDSEKKMRELRADTATPQDEKRPKMQAIREDADKKLKEILTADQYKKYEAMPRPGRGGKKKKSE
jgi:protein CpxP